MKVHSVTALIRDLLVLTLFVGLALAAGAGLVATNSGAAPVVLVVAVMTPLICSAAVQLYQDIREQADHPRIPEGP